MLGSDSHPSHEQPERPPAAFYSLSDRAPQLGVDRLVPIYNYNNADARAIAKNIGIAAMHEGIEVAEIHTVKGGARPNAEVLYDNRTVLGPHALAIHIGGDGTAHTVANGIRIARRYTPEIYQTKRLFHQGGTACDTAKALNTPKQLANLSTLLDRGWLVDMYPLEMHVDTPGVADIPDIIHALSYMSLGGFTGLAAEYINRQEHRQRYLNRHPSTKRLAQGLTGLRALRDAQKVDMTIGLEPRRSTLDIHCLSGPIMATLKHYGKELTEPGFHVVENQEPRFFHLLSRALRLGNGTLIDTTTPARLNLEMTVHSPAILQADGETWRVPAGTTVSVKPGEPFQAVTTRPKLYSTNY